jgi:putative ABC transport system ATP-binding protein
MPTAAHIENLRFRWHRADADTVDIPELSVERGERLFISGPSGSGKSTLLSLLAGIVTPQHGQVTMLDRRVSEMSAAERDHFRSEHIGYIFQLFNLVPYLTVVENVTLPLRFSKKRWRKAGAGSASSEAVRLLEHLGLAAPEIVDRPVTALSVGQQQRVAAARALIGCPEVVIADEPTSSLDADNRESFINLLFQECEREKATLIFVSHDQSLGGMFDRTFEMQDAGCRMQDGRKTGSESHILHRESCTLHPDPCILNPASGTQGGSP